MTKLLGLLMVFAACSATQVNVSPGTASSGEKQTAQKVGSYASSTPPAGATSMGMKSQPTAGGLTIPVTNVEVFVFTANVDDDASDETLYWATDGDAVYVWGQIDLDCVDDNGSSTGETGVADFVYEGDSGGWGWMTSTDSCGYSTLFGCSDDGTGEVCGGCDWDESYVACVSAS
ncbi:MAG TPA: hypothetical protein VGC41_15405 [Kofleriaceae bacterium]